MRFFIYACFLFSSSTFAANLSSNDPNYSTLRARAQLLAQENPQYVTYHTIGSSHEKNEIFALKLSLDPNFAKPSILIDGQIHARENSTQLLVIALLEQYLSLLKSEVAGDALRMKSVLEKVDFWFVPIVNPDGNLIVNKGINGIKKNADWRKNASPHLNSKVGVDLNRNFFSTLQETCGLSSTVPRSDYYIGPYPTSEPETQALSALAAKIRPIGYLTYHSTGNIVIAPTSCDESKLPANESQSLRTVGEELAANLGFEFSYTWGGAVGTGTSKNSFYELYGTYAYTIEVGKSNTFSVTPELVNRHTEATLSFTNKLLSNLLQIRSGEASESTSTLQILWPHRSAYGRDTFYPINYQLWIYKVLLPGAYEVLVSNNKHIIEMTGEPRIIEVE